MKIGLLFLTYGLPIHTSVFEKKGYVNNPNCNIIIHAKEPEAYEFHRWNKYMSKYLIETSWGSETIVVATLLLLEQAFLNGVDWFILCSGDSYPLFTFNDIISILKKQKNSMFELMSDSKINNKTSQWWALNKKDVDILLNFLYSNANYNILSFKTYNFKINASNLEVLKKTIYLKNLYKNSVFKEIITNIPKSTAIDERFFLPALQKIYKLNYIFTNTRVHYVKWIEGVPTKHPVIFNRLLPNDIKKMKEKMPLFVRKTFPSFKEIQIIPKKNAVILTIGSENVEKINDYSEFLKKIGKTHDLFILSLIDDTSKINNVLKENCIQLFFAFWNQVENAYSKIQNELINYSSIKIIREYEDANTVSFENEFAKMPIEKVTTKEFMPDYKIAYLFLTRGDVNQPEIWYNYLTEKNEFGETIINNNVNIYVHPKNSADVSSFLKNYIIPESEHKETGWGYIVDAYFSMFRYAYNADSKNMKFVIISESCVPIYDFKRFKQYLDNSDYRESFVHFMELSAYDAKARIQTQPNYKNYSPFTKHYARMCLSRYHVDKLLNMSENAKEFFIKMHVGDEFFLTLLHARPDYDFFTNKTITYDNWDYVKNQITDIKKEIQNLYSENKSENKSKISVLKKQIDDIGKNPKTYNSVTDEDVQNAFKSEAFFWRKFPNNVLYLRDYYNSNGALLLHRNSNTSTSTKNNQIVNINPINTPIKTPIKTPISSKSQNMILKNYSNTKNETMKKTTNSKKTKKTQKSINNYYDVLEISRDTKSCRTIKKAYRRLALIHHPDKGGDIEKFKQIQNAYEKLMQICANSGGATRRKKHY